MAIVGGVAGADLSSSQFLWVYADGADGEKLKVAPNTGNATVVGILENAPGDDEAAEVTIEGLATAIAGAAIEPFDYVTSDASGKCKPAATSGDYVLGRYVPQLENGAYRDAAADDRIRIQVLPLKTVQIA